jgi:hypothetical protein
MKTWGVFVALIGCLSGPLANAEAKDIKCTIKWDESTTALKESASGNAYYWENDELVVLLKRHSEDPNRFQVVMVEDLPAAEKQALLQLAAAQSVGPQLGESLKKAISRRARMVYAAFYQNVFLLEESLQGHDFALSCVKVEAQKLASVGPETRK